MRFRFLACLMPLIVCACGDSTPKTPQGVTLNRGNVGEPKSLDPQFATTQWEGNIAGDIMSGLLVNGPDGKPMPGAAESWQISSDGLTWTFQLRPEQWSDGKPVTAGDFVFAWQRVLDPKTVATSAFILYVVKNAKPVNQGKLPPGELGVRAVNDATLEVTLEHPASYLPELLTQAASSPLPRHVVEAKGAAWSKPENFVGNGAFVPKEWIANDHIRLAKNARFYDAADVKIDTVNYFPTSDYDSALKRLRAGELDIQSQFGSAQGDWVKKNMPDAWRRVPDLVLFYVAINNARKPFSDMRVREALNLAFDREAVTGKIRRMGEPPAYGIVPPGVANYPGGAKLDFAGLGMAERIARAQNLMRAAGYGPDKMLHTTYLTNTSSDNKVLAPAIQQMMKAAYIDIEIVQVEPAILYQRLRQHDFDLGGASWVADYNDASNFLGSLLSSDSDLNYSQYRNPQFDALMTQAEGERDANARGQKLLAAEKLALAEFALIPYRYSVTPDLVQPHVKGWIANPKGVNMSRWLSVEGRK